jgi:hypothetical protein
MRYIFAGLLIVVIMPFSMAIAEDGTHATLTMTTKIDMGEMLPPEMAGEDPSEPMVMNGELWLTDNRMRMDIDVGYGPPQVTIIDLEENAMYTIDNEAKTALRHDLSQYQEAYGSIGGDFMSPANMFTGWDAYLESIQGTPGVEYTELGVKQISGFTCKGISFTVDTAKLMEDVDTSEIPGGGMIGALGDYSGETWFSEEVGMMPVAMNTQMDMMGMAMEMDWLLTDIEAWSATDSTFAIPEGYTVEDFDMESMFEAPNMPGEAEQPLRDA